VTLQLPKFMELIGLGYTGWFVYRYLLFKVHPLIEIPSPHYNLSSSQTSSIFGVGVN
jgi:hypothetical protein